jgi:hypothetical protein
LSPSEPEEPNQYRGNDPYGGANEQLKWHGVRQSGPDKAGTRGDGAGDADQSAEQPRRKKRSEKIE